jgi:hypothetical protein
MGRMSVGRTGFLRRALVIIFLGAALSGCATVPTQAPTQTRTLSSTEKIALAASLSQTMKDPGAAQFKWMPVLVREGNDPIGYCAQINGKNSYGGYEGFKPFFAMISKNAKGDFDRGTIQHIAGREQKLFGPDVPIDEVVETGLTQGNCQKWGYPEVSAAQ